MTEFNDSYPSLDKPWLKYYDEEALASIEVPNSSIYEELRRTASKHPRHIAIEYLGVKVTYDDLIRRIDIAADSFASLGIGANDHVPLITANTPENVVALYALNKIGAVAHMVDLTLKESDLADKINDSSSHVVVATDVFLGSLEAIRLQVNIDHIIVTSPADSMPVLKRIAYRMSASRPKLFDGCIPWNDFMECGSDALVRAVSYEYGDISQCAACVMYTSGTTGKSKGVVLTNRNLVSMVQEYANCGLKFAVGDRMFNENPPFISYCVVLGINLPLALGMCIVMFPSYEPSCFAERVFKAKAQHVLACPADWSNFFVDGDAQGRNYSFMSTLASGGVGFNPKKKEELNILLASLGCENPIVEGYGMTEGSSALCTAVPDYNRIGTVGIPLPLMNACIWNAENEQELGFGRIGEICFSGPTVMKGYLHDSDATRNALQMHPDGEIWLHTGDLGSIREDGGIEIVGRIKRLIVRHDGFKISPFDIEAHINACADVAECCVVSSDDIGHGFGSVPVAFVVLKGGVDSEKALVSIRAACESALPERNLPAAYIPIGSLPLTKVGKVDYRKLERMANEQVVDDREARLRSRT